MQLTNYNLVADESTISSSYAQPCLRFCGRRAPANRIFRNNPTLSNRADGEN